MRRGSRFGFVGASVAFALSVFAADASATAVDMGPPDAPLPTPPGPGLDATWASLQDPSMFKLLDVAMTLLSAPGTVAMNGVGPIAFSNFLLPLGDSPTQSAMPFSPQGDPLGGGEYIVTSMKGFWAARAAGVYTIAAGSDDGYRVTMKGTRLLDYPHPQSFARAAKTISVPEPGLYAFEVDYFNGIQEGAFELWVTTGEVAITAPTQHVPAGFTLVPQADLYPVSASSGGTLDAGTPATDGGSGSDAGSSVDSGSNGVDAGHGSSD
ncbi:MAG TPA: hypothetical protein VGI39_32605, partial [Polyangiaceae bacterium]